MIWTLEFAALGGTFLQVSACRPNATVFAYRIQNLCLDSRVLPAEPGCPDHTVFNHALLGGVEWLGDAPFRETRAGSMAPRAYYSGGSLWARRTMGDTIGISLSVPRLHTPHVLDPIDQPCDIFPGTLALTSHLLERKDDADAAFVDDSVDAWILWLEQQKVFSITPREHCTLPTAQKDASDAATMSALTQVLRATAERPRVVDLVNALGLSERQVSRRLQKLLPAAGSPSSTFREAAHRWRLAVAAILLASRPTEKISVIATAAGFSGTAALDHCLRDAGLGSPLDLLRILGADRSVTRETQGNLVATHADNTLGSVGAYARVRSRRTHVLA